MTHLFVIGIADLVRTQGPAQKLKCRERVGFASLPDQLVNYELGRGFTLNIMLIGTYSIYFLPSFSRATLIGVGWCAGPTGIGKSTLLDSLFKTSLPDAPQTHGNDQVDSAMMYYTVRWRMLIVAQVDLRVTTYELEESGVNLTLTVAESTGFGDQINRVSCSVRIYAWFLWMRMRMRMLTVI